MRGLKRPGFGKWLARFRPQSRDMLQVAIPSSGARPTVDNPKFGRQMNAARTVLKKRRRLLRELAK